MGKKGFDLGELARGLAKDGVSNLNTTVEDVRSLPAEKISVNAGNFYEKSDIDELAASIQLTGLIHPIVVKEDGEGGYTIIDGERRFTAMQELGMEEIPAIVRRPVNDVLEELMLIEANRTQRKMSSADIAVQAERYTELLAKLKESGVEISGRLRDRVAEAMQISSAKLGRLHAIMENLTEPYLSEFKAGTISESVAYELSKLEPERQKLVAGRSTANLTVDKVTSRNAYADAVFQERECPFGGDCGHSSEMFQLGKDKYSYQRCVADWANRNGCCKMCPDRLKCKRVCEKCAPGILAEQMKAAEAEDKRKVREEKKALKQKAAAAADWARLRALRERAGFKKANDPKITSVWSMYPQYETRERLNSWNVGYTVADAIHISALMGLAKVFGCSTDEVLGLPDPGIVPGMSWHPASEPVPETITGKVATWGVNGLSAIKAGEFADYRAAWPELYQWWAEVKGPTEEEEEDD